MNHSRKSATDVLDVRALTNDTANVRVYFNTSALNRPFDDLSVPRVRQEAVAVASVLEAIEAGDAELVGSEYLDFELAQNPDPERAERTLTLVLAATKHVRITASIASRARELEAVGLRGLDALHVAAAEAGGAYLLITTDDRMLRRVRRLRPESRVRALLPTEALRVLNEKEKT